MQEQELFQGYEVKNWDFNPRIYKILAVSAIFNILAILVIGQTNLLTTKGCDSPLVGGVCQVIDTLVVGGTALTTDTEYVDKQTPEITEITDADIIWINRTGDDNFKYPEGYFALSNPELTQPEITEIQGDGTFPANIPGVNPPNSTTGGGVGNLFDKPQELPKQNDKAVTNKMPDSPFKIDDNPTISKVKPQKPYRPKNPKNTTLDDNSPKQLPNLTEDPKNKNLTADKIEINKEPMRKLASDVKVKFQKKEIDLSQNFKIIADGTITKDGKLELTKDKTTKKPTLLAEGNEQMVEVGKQAINALGESGYLVYLRNQGIEKINFTLVQDNDNLQVIITSDQPTPERANTVASGFNSLMQAALLADTNGWKKLGDDEKLLLNSAKVTVNPQNTKQFVLNFVLPKQTALEMITRKLNEPEVKPTDPAKPQGTAQIKENNQKTAE